MPIFFIPARGRKPSRAYSHSFSQDFLYPREGTETIVVHSSLPSCLIFFIPARGRKLVFSQSQPKHADFLYPREGMETIYRLVARTNAIRIFFIPARGRKHSGKAVLLANGGGFYLSPRGDGNSAAARLVSLSPDFLYPREGTET